MKRPSAVIISCRHRRAGVSWLELQAACAVFAILLSGLAPFTVMYLKQVAAFEKRLDPAKTYYLVPASNPWSRKLGADATLTATAPAGGSPRLPMPNAGVQILSFDESLSSDEVTVTLATP